MNADRQRAIEGRLNEAVRAGVFPGCVALVWGEGGTRYFEATGFLANDRAHPARHTDADKETIYDLSSLTKVLCTTTVFAQGVSRGAWSLDERLPPSLCPHWSGRNPRLTELLEHAAGFEAHREYFLEIESGDRDAMIDAVRSTPPAYEAGRRSLYSDLGFILLGAFVEEKSGLPLDRLFEEWVRRPLGMDAQALTYRPLGTPREAGIAPTEVYKVGATEEEPSYFRVRSEPWAEGEVHDDNAWRMGGVAGHAGLFGTAEGVFRVAQAWIEAEPLSLEKELRDRFWTPSEVPGSVRCLGWDGVSPGSEGTTGGALSSRAVGHLGFSGTSLWIDPSSNAAAKVYILLSNRVHPRRDRGEGMRALRRDFHRLAAALF